MAEQWHPWRELSRRPHIALGIEPLPASVGGGVYAKRGEQAAIVLCKSLTQVERRCVLSHELIHDEWGVHDHPDAPKDWQSVVAQEERRVDDEAVRRLVPLGELMDMCCRRLYLEPPEATEPWQVAEWFGVTEKVATRALELLDCDGAEMLRRNGHDPGEFHGPHPT